MSVGAVMNRFLIVGTQRTGSSALAESIGLHRTVTCGWEWTQRVSCLRKLRVTERALGGDFSVLDKVNRDHMSRAFHRWTIWLGFRRLFRSSDKWIVHPKLAPALWLDRLEHHLNWLAKHENVHIIHIVRCDNLAWLRSKYLARKSKFFVGRPYPEGMRVAIPVAQAIARVRAKEWVDSRLATMRNTNPYLRIYYEVLLKDIDGVSALALQFLNCDPTDLQPDDRRIHRQARARVSEQITNYNELADKLMHVNLLRSSFDHEATMQCCEK